MKRKFKFTILFVFILFILVGSALNIYVYKKGSKYIVSSIEKVPQAQVAIILGAAVSTKGVPSPVLEDRIVMAINLYKQGKVSKILMSGGNPTIINNEVDPVKKELLQNGIPEQDIFLDHAGFDTYSSMYRAKSVFNIKTAIIVTQAFHLPRALYIARSLDIDAHGLAADRGAYLYKNYLRELISRPNAFWDILIHRTPKYLGPSIPITGDGSQT
jgi:SanA protein